MSIRQVGDLLCQRYEVRSVLGTRPLGVLYRAFDQNEKREVSVRTFAAELLPNDSARDHFQQHLLRSISLEHSHWVRLHEVAFDAGHAILIADWVSGWQLSSQIATGALPFDQLGVVVAPICTVLRYVHENFGPLGDVRAENILLSHGQIRVLSRGAGLGLPRDRYLAALRGTAIYARLAPEILDHQPVDARIDVYSLALLIAELLSGTLPELPLRQLPFAPGGLVQVLASALSPDPDARPGTIREFTAALELFFPLLAGAQVTRTEADHDSVPTIISVPQGSTRPVGMVDLEEAPPATFSNVPEPTPKGDQVDITQKMHRQEVDALRRQTLETYDLSGVVPSSSDPTVQVGSIPEYIGTSSQVGMTKSKSKPPGLGFVIANPGKPPHPDWLRFFGLGLLGVGLLVVLGLLWQMSKKRDQAGSVQRSMWQADVRQAIRTADEARKSIAAGPNTQKPTRPLAVCSPGQILVPTASKRFCIDRFEYSESATLPRVNVAFAEAAQICADRGGRLCLEAEWEQACRGKGESSYPYGSKYAKNVCNTQATYRTLLPSGSLGQCRSFLGVYDMSGNAAEWAVAGQQNSPVLKGGSGLDSDPSVRCSHSTAPRDREGSAWVGFRCCSDVKIGVVATPNAKGN